MTLENRRVESEKDRIMRRDWIRKAKEQDRQIEEVRHGDVPFLEFPLLRETKMVVHGFTTVSYTHLEVRFLCEHKIFPHEYTSELSIKST